MFASIHKKVICIFIHLQQGIKKKKEKESDSIYNSAKEGAPGE